MSKGIGIVSTEYGKIRGFVQEDGKYEGITYFKGVPYAKAPVGELRWRPPVDHDGWEDVRECTEYAPIETQKRISGLAFEPYASDFYYMGNPECSEDCLYLNITTGAQSADEKRPVYMWFHGGGLADGYSYEIEFDPSEFARKGIIVVTVAQRLNIFGYLALPQLSAEQGGKSGNYGFMDEVKALDWVYKNISAFGGDPENITIGGQSGGTMKTGALAASPYNQGRVKRVINESSLCWRRMVGTLEQAQERCMQYLEFMGINPNATMEELRAIPALDLLKEPDVQGPPIPSMMIYDGDYVPNQNIMESIDLYAGDCDYLCGSNYGESSMTRGFMIGVGKKAGLEDIKAIAKENLGELYDKYNFDEISGLTEENSDHRSRWLASLGITGMGGVAEFTKFGALRAEKHPKSRTFSYIFSHVPPIHPEEKGTRRDSDSLLAWHSSELWYAFNSLREGIPPVRPWTALDFELGEKINNYWVNFIKTGDPNGNDLPIWPESRENRGWMELGDELVGHDGIEGDLGKLIFENFDNDFNK